MALDTYTNLKLEIADWLNRSDLTAVIPTFITLAEAEMKRRLRRSSTRTTISLSTEETTAPTDMAELRSLVLETGSPSSDVPFRLGTAEMLSERKARNGGATGRPDTVAHIAGKIVVAPIPDATYTARIVYYTQITALSGSVATNTVLTEAPDAYLYGALLQAEPYLEHDERVPIWEKKFGNAIDQLNDVRDREESNATIKDVRIRAFA